MATIKYKDENGQWQEIAVGGGGTAAEGGKFYPVYVPSVLMVEELSEEQKAANAQVYQSVVSNEDAVYYLYQTYQGIDMHIRIMCTGTSNVFGQATLQAYIYGVNQVTQFAITINSDGSIVDTSGEIPLGGESVEVVDNLESESATAALSANQGRVLKEYVDSTIAQAITTTLNTEV